MASAIRTGEKLSWSVVKREGEYVLVNAGGKALSTKEKLPLYQKFLAEASGGRSVNLTVGSREEAEKLLQAAVSDMKQVKTYGPKANGTYQFHPVDNCTGMGHIKFWKPDGTTGHIYYPGK